MLKNADCRKRFVPSIFGIRIRVKYDGAVAACGLAQGSDLPATVMPFILRDVTLAGVNSVLTPREKREEAWVVWRRISTSRSSTA